MNLHCLPTNSPCTLHLYLCDGKLDEGVPLSKAQAVSLSDAVTWYADGLKYCSSGSRGDITGLLHAIAAEVA